MKTKKKEIGNISSKQQTSVFETLSMLLQMIFPLILCIAFHIFCNKYQCSITTLPDLKHFSSFSEYIDIRSLLVYFALALAVSLIGSVPFGGQKVKSLNPREPDYIYCTNGFFCMIICVLIFLALEYSGIIISAFVVEHIIPLVVTANLFYFVICLTNQVKSYCAPEWAIATEELNSSFLRGFFNGRELNARIFSVDIKFLFLRMYTTSMIIIDLSFLIRSFNTELASVVNNLQWQSLFSNPTLLVLVIMHTTYFGSHLYNERTIPTTRFVLSEPIGYKFITTSFIWWSGLIAQTKYIAEHNIQYPTWELIALLVIDMCGQFFYVISNGEKDDFKKDPSCPKFESIPSNVGKNILCSGTWKFVRQPNILADIIIHLVWLRFGWNALPALGVLSLIQMMVERGVASQADCKKRYGKAWEIYCKKVKYVIIPMIY